jgi:hypothetical protein
VALVARDHQAGVAVSVGDFNIFASTRKKEREEANPTINATWYIFVFIGRHRQYIE